MNERPPTRCEELETDPRVHRVELLISSLLRIGVVTSLSIVIIGTVISFWRHPDYTSVPAELRRLTSPGAAFPYSLRDVWHGVVRLRGQAIVVLGLLMLISTPVIRVAVSIFAFLYQRDWRFVLITATVLVLLLLSFGIGKVGG